MSFGSKGFLLGLLVIPLLGLLVLWARTRARRDLQALFGQGLSTLQLPDAFWRRRAWKSTGTILALGCALFALAQPRWGHTWREKEVTGLEVVVALDVSRSMDAQDADPSRIERARREVLDLLEALPQSRVGLVVFAGGAYPRMPQTLDHKALRSILKRTDTQTIRAQGSSIASALEESLGLMDLERNADRALVLLSDGEGWDSQIDKQLAAIQDAGVRIYSVGIGSATGAPIPNATGGFKKDRHGEVIITQLQEAMLKRLASESGGAYLHSVGGASDTRELVAALNAQLQASVQGKTREKVWNERFQWPLGLALLVLFMVAFTRDARPVVGLLLVLAMAAPGSAFAAEAEAEAEAVDVRDPRALWSLALENSKAGKHEQAYRTFSEIAERAIDPALRLGARYNAGNAAYGAGRLEQAVQAWEQALELDPTLEAAQKNAEAVRQEIAQRLQEPPPEEENPEDSEDSEDGEDGEEGEEQESDSQDSESEPSEGERDAADPDEEEEAGEMPEPSEADGEESPEKAGEEQPLAQGVQEMSPEEAMRLLEAVEEGRPFVVVPGNSSEKDW